MAKKRIGSDEERLEDSNIERVIKYLSEKGATKKVACQMLNIAYNTTRLDKVIEQYKAKKVKDAERRAEKRGKPATPEEVAFIISEYLEGATIDGISKSLFRGNVFIKSILDRYAVPERNSSQDYFHPKLIPEDAVKTEFRIGEKVWSARYDALAEILFEVPHKQEKVYRIYLYGNQNMYAYQPASELAGLDKLRESGVSI